MTKFKTTLTAIAVLSAALLTSASIANAQFPGLVDPGVSTGGGASGSGLLAVETNVDGGQIPIGATAQVVVRFRNEGGQPVQTGVIQLYPSSTVSATVASNQCSTEELPSGAECAIALSVKGLQAGPWRAEMLMAHSGRTRLVTATLSGTVESTGDNSDRLTSDVETIPNELDFGSLNSSQTLVEPIILRNITSVPINISEIYVDASESAGYKLNTQCEKLNAGQACIATVSWSPKLEGRSSGVLVIKHDGPAGLSSVSLKGEFIPDTVEEAEVFPRAVPGKGLLVASQTDIDFGDSVATASAITVSLVNAGDTNVNISDIRLSSTDNGIGFKDSGCNTQTVLEPIEACPLTITWSPTRVGTVFDDIQIIHDGARGILVLPIRGEASGTVSQDQKAIDLSESIDTTVEFTSGVDPQEANDTAAQQQRQSQANQDLVNARPNINISGVLDGYKITSFSPTRAIINGPGGSRLVYNNEEIVLGGVPWFVVIQKNGIEFLHKKQRILLLFDRSLSSINRVQASSGGENSGSGSTSETSSGDTSADNI
ncbi:MAG: choice-of-anchor D domain-containing protein [Bdellovibrionales bacterium]